MLAPSPTTTSRASLPKNPSPSLRLAARAELELRRRRRQRQIAAWAQDPTLLARDAGYTPDPWQEDLLTSRESLVLCNVTRQGGKSQMAALLALWHLIAEPGLVLIVAPSLRQSHETMRACLRAYRALSRPIPAVHVTMTALELENGGRLLCLPGKGETIRGFSKVSLLICEEAALIPDETYASVSPMLAISGGRTICLFTPHGKAGWLWGLWSAGEGEQITVPATACPRIPPSFLASEQRRIGDYWYQQEYCCLFQEPSTAAFREEDIQAAVDGTLVFDKELFA